MSYSDWLKIDLHIHSVASNAKKTNDYSGKKYTVTQLLSALDKEKMNLFSITDHNCINVELYNELINKRTILQDSGKNFIVGCELDIYDVAISSETFHSLLFFDTDELDLAKLNKINTLIEELTTPINGQSHPDLDSIFRKMRDCNQLSFILIPHFNNKSKGLKVDVVTKSLPMMVFDAFEDTNNIDKIEKSFKKYFEAGYVDFPVCIFSDCHDIDAYPQQRMGEEKTVDFPHLLGNIEFPFSSLKVAFQDASLRIAFDALNTSRSIKGKGSYIKELHFGDTIIRLSPYQNTIIGGFGSGKSFLMDLIKNGKDNAKKQYHELTNVLNHFKLIMSDSTERASLSEVDELCILKFEQDKDIFHINIIEEANKDILQKNLNIKFPELAPIPDMSFETLQTSFDAVSEILGKSVTDHLNYNHLTDNIGQLTSDTQPMKYSGASFEKSGLVEDLVAESNKTIFGICFYNQEERKILQSAKTIISDKNDFWKMNIEMYNRVDKSISERIEKFNADQLREHKELEATRKISLDIKQQIKRTKEYLANLKKECDEIEQNFCEPAFNKYCNTIKKDNYLQYSFATKYKQNEKYRPFKSEIFKEGHRKDTFFLSLLSTLIGKVGFHQNKSFNEAITNYYNKYFSANFKKFQYDILKDEKSIMQNSAGEKANILMDLIFSILEEKTKNKITTVLLIDQPEDNLDNKNINGQIVSNLTRMKKENTLPQCIFVSHNANIAISADSENIIIAKKQGNCCSYCNSGIEDINFMKTVCSIMEGGQNALKRRGMKFLVSYQKTYEAKDESNND